MKKVVFAVARCVVVIAFFSLVGCSFFGVKSGSGSTGTISGAITIAGYPVQGVTVTAGSVSTTTDSKGNYSIGGLAGGSYTVTPSLTNYGFAPLSSKVDVGGTSPTNSVNFSAGPALLAPQTYNSNINSQTASVLIAVKPIGPGLTFSPWIGGGYLASSGALTLGSPVINFSAGQWIAGCAGVPGNTSGSPSWTFTNDPTGQQVTLVDSTGTIVAQPSAQITAYTPVLVGGSSANCSGTALTYNETFKPLTQKPLLELTAFWQLIGPVTRYAANTNTTVSQSVTYGVTQTSESNFSNTIKASVGASYAGFSASISDTFSQSTSNSMSITHTSSTTDSFQVKMSSTQEGVYAPWQLVYQIAIVRKATASEIAAKADAFGNPVDPFGYVLFSDPNFTNITPTTATDVMTPSYLAPVDILQQNDVVPQMTLFPVS